MYTEPDDAMGRLQHEKNVWRGIAIGLAATLILLLAFAAVGTVFLLKSTRAARAEEAARAEQAMQEAMQQRQAAEKARMEADEARRVPEKHKAKR